MFLDFLTNRPQPPEWEEPEEEVSEEKESRYEQFKPDVYQFDKTDWDEEEAEDEERLRRVTGLKLLTKREWWRLRLTVDRLKREVADLRTRVNVSADKKFQDEAIQIRDLYYSLLGQSVKDAATIDSLNDQLALKDERVEELKEEKEQLKQQIRSLMTINTSVATGKAVQKSVIQPTQAEDGMKAHQFVSATGRTAAENKQICYWLLKAGKSTDEVYEISGIKSVSTYARQGEKLLKEEKVSIRDDGITHTKPASELDPWTGEHPDYPGCEVVGYSFPELVVDVLSE